MDYQFTGDWPGLLEGQGPGSVEVDLLGDPQTPGSGIVELVELAGADEALPPDAAPRHGFFLLSLQREVDETLSALAALRYTDVVASMRGPGRKDRHNGGDHRAGRGIVELIGPAK